MKKSGPGLTVEDIVQDPITQLASLHWAPRSEGSNSIKFDVNVVREIYATVIKTNVPGRLQLLELSGYLENYLWPFYGEVQPLEEHTFSIVHIINEKFREGGLSIFDNIVASAPNSEEKFETFFKNVILWSERIDEDDTQNKIVLVSFLINIYQGLECPAVRRSALKYLSLPMWETLPVSRREREFSAHPPLRRHWEHRQGGLNADSTSSASSAAKKAKKADGSNTILPSQVDYEALWIPRLIQSFLSTVQRVSKLCLCGDIDGLTLLYLERFAELLFDWMCQLPTRRFLTAIINDLHVVLVCERCLLCTKPQGKLFAQLVAFLKSYVHFPVQDQSGQALTEHDLAAQQASRIHHLQSAAHSLFPAELGDLVYSSTGEISKRSVLKKHLLTLSVSQLIKFALKLGTISDKDFNTFGISASSESDGSVAYIVDDTSGVVFNFVADTLLDRYCLHSSQVEELNGLSLYPTEELLWDPNQIPLSHSFVAGCTSLALPKLNVQFLTLRDYLLRSFILYRLESAFEVREDIVDAIKRVLPRATAAGAKGRGVSFGGWSRMALPIISCTIDEVGKPLLGEIIPRSVTSSVEIDVSRFTGDIRAEWEALREHDVVFLVCIEAPEPGLVAHPSEGSNCRDSRRVSPQEEPLDFPSRYGVRMVRGAEIFEVRDEDNVVLNDMTRPDERRNGRVGSKRKLRLNLDCSQYFADVRDGKSQYESFNLLIRRKPEENNFKSVLETIRDLMNSTSLSSFPSWMTNVFLGYGDPSSANYRTILNQTGTTESANYIDTFLDSQHVIDSFPLSNVMFEGASGDNSPSPPFSLTFSVEGPRNETQGSKRARDVAEETAVISVQPVRALNMGPFPEDIPPSNSVRFTPAQVEAIRSGMNPGLTMIVGPPGTGKTDVAVQIIAALYRNHPTQKILLVTHSNAALNDLFEKIMQRDIDPRHLLRLGGGERELSESLAAAGAGGDGRGQGEHFSKQGRVNWSLSRRLQLLGQVQKLAISLGIPGDVGYTCETAGYFQVEHIRPRIDRFHQTLVGIEENKPDMVGKKVADVFPFNSYFSSAPKAVFTGNYATDVESAAGCLRHIEKLFAELNDYRAFELLRTQAHRSDYLLTKQARIIAMTCTHAAITRRRLVELNFHYDSLIMEEAAQVLEVETLIPMLLQTTGDLSTANASRLKRVVLIGDHLQLPPVVKHMAFQKYAKLDQSMFSRFIRLGVPRVLLDKQGRARPEIAALYAWRYRGLTNTSANGLGNLESVVSTGRYSQANAGFVHSFQLVNVPDFQGKGESAPTPHFYQNLGEAEYVVAVYQYMRLLGYPAEKISILTTYNGQKNLIRDIVAQRCRSSVFGPPAAISTVDKYQGQQNDYILLSLVRTETVGHVRDIRRLVVAVSRARLGFYVFCRQALFESCYELAPTFRQFRSRPSKLQLVVGESFPTFRANNGDAMTDTTLTTFEVEDVTAMGVLVYQMVQHSQHLTSQAAAAAAAAESQACNEQTAMQVDAAMRNESDAETESGSDSN